VETKLKAKPKQKRTSPGPKAITGHRLENVKREFKVFGVSLISRASPLKAKNSDPRINPINNVDQR